MESARERLRQFEKKSLSVDEKMAEIRLVNRAKWLLISELKMSEPDAHRYIEKQPWTVAYLNELWQRKSSKPILNTKKEHFKESIKEISDFF